MTRIALLRYRSVMSGVVRSMGVNGSVVEDVVHDAFEMACRKPETERPDTRDESRFLSWLCTLAKYAALTARNDSARNREVSSPSEDLEDVPEPNRAYIGHYDDKVAAAVVFANLNADDRQLLHQHFYEDKTVQELAAERGIPWTTMRSRLDGVIHRARSIMDDKSYRRRAVGASLLMWISLSISQMRAQLFSWWAHSKRTFAAGMLGFVTGGAVVAAFLHHKDEPILSFVETHMAPIGATNLGFSGTNPRDARIPAGTSVPTQVVACSLSMADVVVPMEKAIPEKPQSNVKTPVSGAVEERSRAIVPWSISAVLRDDKHKGK